MKTESGSKSNILPCRRIRILGIDIHPNLIMENSKLKGAISKFGETLGNQESKIPPSYRKFIWSVMALAYVLLLMTDLFKIRQEGGELNTIQITSETLPKSYTSGDYPLPDLVKECNPQP